jgi:hypothetical protein
MTELSVLFCTPAYGGMVTAAYAGSCLRLKEELTKIGLAHDWLIGINESLVTRARNEMTASFLATKHSHMMWIDADIEFELEDVAKLWNMEADIAVGVYAMKKPDKQWFAAWKDGALVKDLDQFKGPIEVEYAGTGFMLIKREVIEALARTVPSYEGPNGRVPALYMTPIHNDGFESEDYHFCRIAREAGFKIMMDPSVRLGHIGQYRFGA